MVQFGRPWRDVARLPRKGWQCSREAGLEAQIFPPSAIVIDCAFANLEPSRARNASTVTLSPGLTARRVQPARTRLLIELHSNAQFAVTPFSSVTST